MKAIRVSRFGGPEVLELATVPELSPGAGEVVVAVKAAGVNPVDTYLRSGTYPKTPSLPYTPGHDAGGVVAAVGSGVTHVKPGDRVYTARSLSGTYAEQALCRAEQVHPLPETISFSQGAALGVPYATAYRALFQRAMAVPPEVLLVHGASGGVGIAAVQLARARGLLVVGTAGTPRGRELAAREGAHYVLDHGAPDYLEQVTAVTRGSGVHVILEMLANVNLGKDLGLLAPKGRIVVIGSRGTVEIDPRLTMSRDATILGMSLMNASQEELFSIHAGIIAGLRNGTLRPVVGKEIPLRDAARAHTEVLEPGSYGKIVLVP